MRRNPVSDLPPRILASVKLNPGTTKTTRHTGTVVAPNRPATATRAEAAIGGESKVPIANQDSKVICRVRHSMKDGTQGIRIDAGELIGVGHARIDDAKAPQKPREVGLDGATFDGSRVGDGRDEPSNGRLDARNDSTRSRRVTE
eukprot:1907011-Pyramimonas_sp.AAC.1